MSTSIVAPALIRLAPDLHIHSAFIELLTVPFALSTSRIPLLANTLVTYLSSETFHMAGSLRIPRCVILAYRKSLEEPFKLDCRHSPEVE